jgi:hypothetical protein
VADRKIFDRPHFDEHGRFIHPCCICGADAGLGFGVSLLNDRLGTWYCGKCVSHRRSDNQGHGDERKATHPKVATCQPKPCR